LHLLLRKAVLALFDEFELPAALGLLVVQLQFDVLHLQPVVVEELFVLLQFPEAGVLLQVAQLQFVLRLAAPDFDFL